MDSLKHTHGPWYLVETNHQMNFDGTTVCEINYIGQAKHYFIGSDSVHHGDVEKTAKLIAAAPELLEALQKLQAWVTALRDWTGGTTMDPPVDLCRSVIDKATK